MMVMGCAIANRIFLPMFKSRARFDIRAMASWKAFIPINLVGFGSAHVLISLGKKKVSECFGSFRMVQVQVKRTISGLVFQLHFALLLLAGSRPSNARPKHISRRLKPWDPTSRQSKGRRYLRATTNWEKQVSKEPFHIECYIRALSAHVKEGRNDSSRLVSSRLVSSQLQVWPWWCLL